MTVFKTLSDIWKHPEGEENHSLWTCANIETALNEASNSLSRKMNAGHIFQVVMLLLIVFVVYETIAFRSRVRELAEELNDIQVQQNMESTRRYDPRACVRYGHAKIEDTRRNKKKPRRLADKRRIWARNALKYY